MLSMEITEIKEFMNHLLLSPTFDHFYFSEASIRTSCSYYIDGHLNKDFFPTAQKELLEDRNYATWGEMRPSIFSLIKGDKTPLSFKIILLLSAKNTENLLHKYNIPVSFEQINGLFLNISYEEKRLLCTTGTSLTYFSMDKTLDTIFDENIEQFFRYYKIV